MADTQYYGTGRRKTSAARVFMTSGNGSIKINDRTMLKLFSYKRNMCMKISKTVCNINCVNL